MAAIEYLVTGQGYDKSDKYKQTILLHDSFVAEDSDDASEKFTTKFSNKYKLIKIFSVISFDKQEKFV
jgi:hypothetical protein